jgi:predicted dehydrogenase
MTAEISNRPTRVAVIGAGHWGPHLIRNFETNPDSQLVAVCDASVERLRALSRSFPGVRMESRAESVLDDDPGIEAVIIATPTTTHYQLAKRALLSGKHVLVEKPITTSSAEAEELQLLAHRKGLVLLVGHVFLYNEAVRRLKKIVSAAEFGKTYYVHSRRTNLGPVRSDVHAGWDLASHDVSIFLYLLDEVPSEVTASAQTYIRPGVPDVFFSTLFFASGRIAHLHASWLDPQKIRHLTVVGEHQMVVFDDVDLLEPLRIYNKGFRRIDESERVVDTFAKFRVELVHGDVVIPQVSTGEPLRLECQAFLDAIRDGAEPLSNGAFARNVVRVLEALDRSIAESSRRVPVV